MFSMWIIFPSGRKKKEKKSINKSGLEIGRRLVLERY